MRKPLVLAISSAHVVEKDDAEKDADRELHDVIRRLRPAPCQQRPMPALRVARVLHGEPKVRDDKPDTQQQERPANHRLNVGHGSTLSDRTNHTYNLHDCRQHRVL